MADTQTHAHAHSAHTAAHPSDMVAAFSGLVIGAVALFLLLGSIVLLTNRHYAQEKAGAEARPTTTAPTR
jgi:hypothetical protein